MPQQLEIGFADYYDRHADAYLRRKQSGLLYFNDAIEIPAVFGLLNRRTQRQISGHNVLDVGSGLGTYSSRLAEAGANVTAIDISRRMVELTAQACEGLNVRCLHEDFFRHTVDSMDVYDFVIAGFMLGYFQNLDIAFKKFKEITHRGSVVVISSIHASKTPFRASRDQVTNYDYFGRHDYESDFIDKEEVINLKRWIPSEVTAAAYQNAFAIDEILEPRPGLSYEEYGTKELYDFYMKNPSVSIYVLRRR